MTQAEHEPNHAYRGWARGRGRGRGRGRARARARARARVRALRPRLVCGHEACEARLVLARVDPLGRITASAHLGLEVELSAQLLRTMEEAGARLNPGVVRVARVVDVASVDQAWRKASADEVVVAAW